jgi:hypothetical protein
MNGLPPDIDLSFFAGKELHQVCIGRHQAILHFDDNVSLSIESEIAHISHQGEIMAIYKTIPSAAPTLVSLLNRTVKSATSKPPGTLILEFSNSEILEIYDSNAPHYESYQIGFGDKIIVV